MKKEEEVEQPLSLSLSDAAFMQTGVEAPGPHKVFRLAAPGKNGIA